MGGELGPYSLLGKVQALVCWSLQGLGPGVDRDATQGRKPSSLTRPGPRSIPTAPASLPRRAAWAGSGARRLRRGGGGGLLGSPARIKYLLCFVWPLGEGREDCRIDPELRAKRGGVQGRGRCPRQASRSPAPRARTAPRAAGRADRSGLPRRRGAPLPPGNRSPRRRRALCNPAPSAVRPARRPGA